MAFNPKSLQENDLKIPVHILSRAIGERDPSNLEFYDVETLDKYFKHDEISQEHSCTVMYGTLHVLEINRD